MNNTHPPILPDISWSGRQVMSAKDESIVLSRWAEKQDGNTHNIIYNVLNNQYNVIYQRAQTLMTFAGLVITVTGFSGRTIAQTSRAAQLLLVGGMALVLLGAALAILMVLRVRWLSRQMGRPDFEWVREIILERNKKIRALEICSIFLTIGFVFYGASIGLMLLDPHMVLAVPARP
jgi:hypothetical protein